MDQFFQQKLSYKWRKKQVSINGKKPIYKKNSNEAAVTGNGNRDGSIVRSLTVNHLRSSNNDMEPTCKENY